MMGFLQDLFSIGRSSTVEGTGAAAPVSYTDEIGADDMALWRNYGVGKNVGEVGFSGPFSTVGNGPNAYSSQDILRYSNRGSVQNILKYLQARNQGRQAQEEYIKLLKERPGRQGTILTAGGDANIAQTIKTPLTTPDPQKTILGG